MVKLLSLQQPIRRLTSATSATAGGGGGGGKSTKWTSVVGLEIHAQIQSASKLFSGARATFGAPVNTCVSAFDASLPGTLPALNRQCVESAVRTALALDAHVHRRSAFDRKHYFYADMPSGYQITQQRRPLATGGQLTCHVFVPGVTKRPYAKRVRLAQLQLEQDSGKSLHDAAEGKSLVDLNRAGMPLMELVFEPDLSTGEEAAALVKELTLILQRLGTCSCRMEEGALRVDANVSVHDAAGGEPLGTRTEVKNIGSVRGVADAVAYEIRRQCAVRDAGGSVHNETRAWDAQARCTVAMRDKEVQQDYRFMPEPNLPPLVLHVGGDVVDNAGGLISVERLRATLPELPDETRRKLSEEFGLGADVAAIMLNEPTLLAYFYEIRRRNADAPTKLIVNILCNDFLSACHRLRCTVDATGIPAAHMSELIAMLQDDTLNLMLARLVLEQMLRQPDAEPRQLAERNGWQQISDAGRIRQLCAQVLADQPKMVAQFRKGKTKVVYAMAGEIVRQTEQRANMALVVAELQRQLASA